MSKIKKALALSVCAVACAAFGTAGVLVTADVSTVNGWGMGTNIESVFDLGNGYTSIVGNNGNSIANETALDITKPIVIDFWSKGRVNDSWSFIGLADDLTTAQAANNEIYNDAGGLGNYPFLHMHNAGWIWHSTEGNLVYNGTPLISDRMNPDYLAYTGTPKNFSSTIEYAQMEIYFGETASESYFMLDGMLVGRPTATQASFTDGDAYLFVNAWEGNNWAIKVSQTETVKTVGSGTQHVFVTNYVNGEVIKMDESLVKVTFDNEAHNYGVLAAGEQLSFSAEVVNPLYSISNVQYCGMYCPDGTWKAAYGLDVPQATLDADGKYKVNTTDWTAIVFTLQKEEVINGWTKGTNISSVTDLGDGYTNIVGNDSNSIANATALDVTKPIQIDFWSNGVVTDNWSFIGIADTLATAQAANNEIYSDAGGSGNYPFIHMHNAGWMWHVSEGNITSNGVQKITERLNNDYTAYVDVPFNIPEKGYYYALEIYFGVTAAESYFMINGTVVGRPTATQTSFTDGDAYFFVNGWSANEWQIKLSQADRAKSLVGTQHVYVANYVNGATTYLDKELVKVTFDTERHNYNVLAAGDTLSFTAEVVNPNYRIANVQYCGMYCPAGVWMPAYGLDCPQAVFANGKYTVNTTDWTAVVFTLEEVPTSAITYIADGATVATTNVATGGDLTLEDGYVVTGKTFVGWASNGNLYAAGATVNVAADMTFTAVYTDLTTSNLASIRVNDPTGLRFKATVSAESQAALAAYGNVTYGMKLINSSNQSMLIEANNWFDDEKTTYTAVLTNIPEANYAEEITAVAYVTVETANGTITVYADSSCTASLSSIAQKVLADTDYVAKLSATQVAFLEKLVVSE